MVTEARRESNLSHQRNRAQNVQDIGPPPKKPRTKKWKTARLQSDESLQRHLEICYPEAFPLEWSEDHLRLFPAIERAADVGLLKALAMPRGSGKTSIMVRAGLWALLTGRRKYCCIVAATEIAARQLLKGIKAEILYNPQLAEYYGRELHCLIQMEGQSIRARGQRSSGKQTAPEWNADRICFGHIKGLEKTNGAYLTTAGITGQVRGQQTVSMKGEIVRPDLALIDDPQTKESASSETQCKARHETMMGDILGLAGPSREISAITTCTVIYKGDLADRLLDRQLSPNWQGDKMQMVTRWPDNQKLWDQYASIQSQDYIDGGDGSKATAFYEQHQAEMDKGGRVSWPARKGNALSAIQHAYDLKIRDESAFQAEYQNDPLNDNDQIAFDLVAEHISRRTIPVNRNEIPAEAETVTAFVDVQKELLFFALMAWTPSGRGTVIDYGTWPDQETAYFTKSKLRRPMSSLPGSVDQNTDTYHALESLASDLFGRHLYRGDGATLGLQMMAVDAGYSESAAAVRRYCSESQFKGMIHPSIGKYIGANQLPWQQFVQGKRDQLGTHCRLQPPKTRAFGVRELLIDTNWWKTWAAERLISPIGSDRSINLFEAEPHQHRMFAEHCTAEDPTIVQGKTGNQVIEWKQNAGKPNNDYWDCLVGNCCLAGLLGVSVMPEAKKQQKRRKPNSRGKAKLLGRAKRQ